MEPALREHAGTIRELASRWLDPLLGDEAVRRGGGDVVCSPAGLWLALGVVATGAEGETAEEFADLLGVAWREAAPVVTAVARDLAATDALAVATGAWSRIPLRDAFRAALPDVGFGPLDDPAAIDDWVAKATDGLIPALPARPAPETLLVIVGALALKARWAHPFDPAKTRDTPFTPASGETRPVPMMERRLPGDDVWTIAGRDGAVTVVELPCAGEHPALVRFAIGPEGAPPASVMTAAWAPRDTGTPYGAPEVTVRLPRLESRGTLDVTAHLDALGVRRALGRDAEFPGMAGEPLRVDQVLQECLLRVAEEGVEAAAVTQVTMVRAAFSPSVPREVVFDRPFACAVLDATGTVPLIAAYQATVPDDAPGQGL